MRRGCLKVENDFYFSGFSVFRRPVGTPFEDGKFSILIYLVRNVQARWEHIYPSPSGFDLTFSCSVIIVEIHYPIHLLQPSEQCVIKMWMSKRVSRLQTQVISLTKHKITHSKTSPYI